MLRRSMGDKELSAAGMRIARIGHSQPAGHVELECGHELVWYGVARIVASNPGWVPSLNHEARDHAVKRYPAEKWPLHHLPGFGVSELLCPTDQACKVAYGYRRLFFKQPECDHALRRSHHGVESVLARQLGGCRLRCLGSLRHQRACHPCHCNQAHHSVVLAM